VLAITILTIVTAMSSQAGTAKVCYDNVNVTVVDLAPTADFSSMVVKYVVEVAPAAVEKCNSLIVTPVIKKDNTKVIPEILVISGADAKPDKWVMCKLSKAIDMENVRFFTMDAQEPLRIETCKTIPFEDWMDDAEFTTTSQKVTYKCTTCINAFPGEEKVCDVPFLSKPFEIKPAPAKYAFAIPAGIPYSISAKLFYPVNSSAKLDNYLENKESLEVLASLEQDSYFVSSITINGWASPESAASYNQKLSTKRANTLKKLVKDKYTFDESLYTVMGSGEYWESVESFVSTTDNAVVKASKNEILKAIAEISDLDKRESAVKKIAGGAPYNVIKKEVFPHSRFADCKVVYTLKDFNLAEVKALYAKDPKKVVERNYIAWMMQEFDADVALKAAEVYPENESINAFAGCAAASKGQYAQSIEFYKKAVDTPEVANNMGCSYLMLGDANSAKACFDKCANLSTAASNAVELRKVVLNNRYFAK